MRLTDIMKAVTTRVPMTRNQAKEVSRTAAVAIVSALQRGEPVKIDGVGTLTPRHNGAIRFEGDTLDAPPMDGDFLPKKAQILAFDHLLARLDGESFIENWRQIGSSSTDKWAARAKVAASFIQPGDVVADIGCGGQALEGFLPEGSTYLPFDIEARDKRTAVINLDVEPRLPPFQADVIVCLGVLEHLQDPEPCLTLFRQRARRLVLSINPSAQQGHPIFARLGMLHAATNPDIVVQWMHAAGWRIVSEASVPPSQRIFSAVADDR